MTSYDYEFDEELDGELDELAATAHLNETLREREIEIEALQSALRSNRVIWMAVGALMTDRGLTEDEAMQALRTTSGRAPGALREQAQQVVSATRDRQVATP